MPYDNELQLIYPAKARTFAANSVVRNGNDLIVTFDLVNIVATIGLKITDQYIGVSLKKVDYHLPGFGDRQKTQIDEFTILHATWHYGYTIHKAPGNRSGITREVMTIIYVADGAKITEPKNKWQEDDHRTWLMSLPVGSLVGSELNPAIL